MSEWKEVLVIDRDRGVSTKQKINMDTVERRYLYRSETIGREVEVLVFISGRSIWVERPCDDYLEGYKPASDTATD